MLRIWRYVLDVIVSYLAACNRVLKPIISYLGIVIYVVFILGLEFVHVWNNFSSWFKVTLKDSPISKEANE